MSTRLTPAGTVGPLLASLKLLQAHSDSQQLDRLLAVAFLHLPYFLTFTSSNTLSLYIVILPAFTFFSLYFAIFNTKLTMHLNGKVSLVVQLYAKHCLRVYNFHCFSVRALSFTSLVVQLLLQMQLCK
jgi:hypothetical protein